MLLGSVNVAPSAAQTCTHFLNASDGDDGNNGSQTAPVRSLEFAFSTFPSGSVVCTAAGEYFYGPDADGIQLAIPDKSMTFRLESFAGASEVRFSEKELVLAAGSGTVSFEAGSSSELVFGSGVINNDSPDQPDLLNFFHTLSLQSGTLAFVGVNPILEESVGNPTYAHPSNPDKAPPASAAIRFGDGNVTGSVTFTETPRTTSFEGISGGSPLFTLPPVVPGSVISIGGSNALIFPQSLDLRGSSLILRGSGTTTFTGPVELDRSIASLTLDPAFSGFSAFTGTVSVAATGTEAWLDHAGSGTIVFESLLLESASVARSTILNRGSGSLTITELTSDADLAANSGHFLDIQNLDGSLILGSPGESLTYRGSISNASVIEIAGELFLGDTSGSAVITNTGDISVSGSLNIDASTFQITNEGSIDGSGVIQMAADGSIGGSGSWSGITVAAGTVSATGSANFGSVTVSSLLRIVEDGSPVVTDRLSLNGNGSLLLEESSSLSVKELVASGSGARISLPLGTQLEIQSELDVTASSDAFSDHEGRISLEGGSPVSVRSGTGGTVPLVVVNTTPATLSGGSRWRGLEITNAAVTLNPDAASVLEAISLDSDASLSVATSGSVALAGPVLLDETSDLSVTSPDPVILTGNLESMGGSFTSPAAGMRISGQAGLYAPAEHPIVLPLLLLDDPTGFLNVSGSVRVEDSLRLQEAGVLLSAGGRLSITGNLERSDGSFAAESSGLLLFIGTDSQTIAGFSGSVLPSLISQGSDVRLSGGVAILGSLRVVSGDVSILSGSTITLQSDLAVVGGNLTVADNASLTVGTDLNMSAGSLVLGEATLRVQENAVLAGGSLDAGESTLQFPSQQESVLLIDTPTRLHRLHLETGANVTVEGQSALSVSDQLQVDATATLTVGNEDLNIYPGTAAPSVLNNGAIQTRSGALTLLATSGVASSMGGSGWFGNTNINLNDDRLRVSVITSDAFHLSGVLTFTSGGLDLQGAAVKFDPDPGSNPGLHYVLTDEAPANGEVDGQGFEDSSGDIAFNEEGIPFDLRYSGQITTLYAPPAYITSSPIADLVLQTQDPVNTPAIFGLAPTATMRLSGSLDLAENVVLRLQESLHLEGDFVRHDIQGRVSGGAPLILGGQLTDLRLTGPTSSIDMLRLEGTDTFASSTLRLEGTIGSIESVSGRYSLRGPTTAPSLPISVLESVSVSASVWILETTMQIGSSSGANELFIDGVLTFESVGNLSFPHGGRVQISASSSVSTNLIGAGAQENGFIILQQSTLMNAATDLPRLRVNISGGGSDDVFLQGDLDITESLDLVNGDIQLSGFNLTLSGGPHRIDQDGTPSDGTSDGFIGEIAQQPSRITLGRDAVLELGGALGIQAAEVIVDPGAASAVQIRPTGVGLPSVLQTGGLLELRSGLLDLGPLDWVISSSSSGLLTTSGGSVSSQLQELDPSLPWSSLDDDRVGELVLVGTGNASIIAASAVSLDALRVDGTVRMAASSLPMMVRERLVFGQNGASLLTNAAGDLTLQEGAQIIRRGLGALSHRPSTGGAVNLAYQLGSGSLTGINTGFTAGSLAAGLESPNQSAVGTLLVAAGSSSSGVHEIAFASDLRVTERVDVISGRLVQSSGVLTLAQGATVNILSADSAAPPGLALTNSVHAEGTYAIRIEHGAARMDIPSNLMAGSPSLESLTILGPESGGSQESVRFLGSFTADQVTVGLVDRPVQLNLTGNDLIATTDFLFNAGTITSSQPATIESQGTARVFETASVTGNIQLHARGYLNLAGAFTGLSLELGGDADLTGSLGGSTRMRLSGTDQSLAFRDQLSVATLEVSQSGSPGIARWVSEQIGSFLRITSGLELRGGVLEMGDGTLIINEAASVIRPADLSLSSHVLGRIQRPASEGSTRELIFPLGNDSGYLPLSLTFSRPLLSSTSISVSLPEVPVLSAMGLPIVDQEAVLTSLANPVWQISSTVDFALAQQYSVAATLPEQAGVGTSPIRMLRQGVGSGSSPWTLLPGTQLTAVTQDGVIARTFDTRGGLSPRGVLLSIGTQAAWQGGIASLQWADARLNGPATERVLMLDDQRLLTLPSSSAATTTVPFFLRGGDTVSGSFHLASVPANELAAAATLSSDSRNWVILTNDAASGTQLDVVSTSVAAAPAAGSTDIVAFNALAGNTDLLSHPAGAAIASIASRAAEEAEVSTQVEYVRVESAETTTETFRVDLTPFGGAHTFWVIAPIDGRAQLRILSTSGQFISPLIVTGNESVDVLPTQAEWLGNYPNPFADRTRVRFSTGESAQVDLDVFDILGRRVQGAGLGYLTAGVHEVAIDASQLASGSYFVRIKLRESQQTRMVTGSILIRR